MARETDTDRDVNGPQIEQTDWDAIVAGEMEPTDTPANGDIRFPEHVAGELPGEDDDNEYQKSDEALPDDREERAIARNPGKEEGLFDDV